MDVKELDIAHAWVFTPRQHGDDRGVFLEWFRAAAFDDTTGRPFTLAQANHSVSTQGTLRGIHFADVPPGQGKYVYCPKGAVLDVVIDIRVGSPTYGQHTTVRLDDVDRRGVFISEGLGHAFVALTDDANVTYLCTTGYNPAGEHGIHPLDPEIGIDWPVDSPMLSAKDAAAPTLAEAAAQGLLPSYDECERFYHALRKA
ncbi:MAG: dTDP-4-dehydrorhamnose 3,5-epimerase [Mycobacteriales bacterium]